MDDILIRRLTDVRRRLYSLWRYTKVGKKRIVPGVLLMIFGSMIFATIPMLARNYIDSIGMSSSAYDLSSEDMVYAILAIVLMVMAWFVLYTMGKTIVVNDISGKTMRDDLATKLSRMKVEDLEEKNVGDITAVISNDVPVVVRSMYEDIPNFFVNLALLLFILVLMLFLNVYLTLVYAILMILSYFVTRAIGNRMHRQMIIRQESMGELNGYFNDALTSHSIIKLYGLEDRVIGNFDRIVEEHRGSYVRTSSAFGFVEPLSRIIDNVAFLVTAVLGSFMLIENVPGFTFSSFLVFISYTAIIGRPLVSFSNAINGIQKADVSYDRILKILDAEELPDESSFEDMDTDSVTGEIVLKDVSFTYPNGTKALDGISFAIRPQGLTVIVGEEGSGKSTVSDLMMGYRIASDGEVLLDGREISHIKRPQVRSVIGISSQDPFVFEDTVYNNLSLTASKEEIERISKLTGFDKYVSRMPKGYNTVVGGRGHGLSSGERQLLSLTRLMLYDPKVMIFDESTSEMDPLMSMKAFSFIRDAVKGKTLLVIDNTPIAVVQADTVVFMGGGKVLDTGTHEELMGRNPAYVRLYTNMTAGSCSTVE